MAKYGWGDCSHCGCDVCITKDGRAHRHGYIRVKRGHQRVAYPDIPSGTDAYSCKGSGKPVINAYFKEDVLQEGQLR